MDKGKGGIGEGETLWFSSVRIPLTLSVRYAAPPSISWIWRDQRDSVMPTQLVPDSRYTIPLHNKLIS